MLNSTVSRGVLSIAVPSATGKDGKIRAKFRNSKQLTISGTIAAVDLPAVLNFLQLRSRAVTTTKTGKTRFAA